MDGPDGRRVVARLTAPPSTPDILAPWPEQVWLEYSADDDIALRVSILGKSACRAPEAFWLSFEPDTPDAGGWRVDKLGQDVDPRDVIAGGGRLLHGVGRGATYRDTSGGFALDTMDAHLIAPGRRALLHHDNEPVDPTGGMHVNLYNNLWGTAFPQWYDQDMAFRFRISLTPPGETTE